MQADPCRRAHRDPPGSTFFNEIGGSRPLPGVATRVRLLNRLPTLDLGGGDYSSCPTADLRGSAIERLSALARRHNRPPSHERSIRLMKDQFIHSPVGGEVELHPEALKLVDDERSALVGTEFVGWLAANCQSELSIVVLTDNSRRASVAERAGAVLTEGRIRAIAAWNAGEDALGWS